MTPTKTATLTPRSKPLLAAIRLGMSERSSAEMRFGTRLVWFMRLLALLWIAQGLANWGLVLAGSGPSPLAAMPDLGIAAIIFFAVLDPIASVGLWLAASWGGIVWLVAVAAEWFCVVVMPGFMPFDSVVSVLDCALVIGYFALTYRAARELDE